MTPDTLPVWSQVVRTTERLAHLAELGRLESERNKQVGSCCGVIASSRKQVLVVCTKTCQQLAMIDGARKASSTGARF